MNHLIYVDDANLGRDVLFVSTSPTHERGFRLDSVYHVGEVDAIEGLELWPNSWEGHGHGWQACYKGRWITIPQKFTDILDPLMEKVRILSGRNSD